MKYTDMQWRVGSQERRTIYAVVPQKHEEEHPMVGVMDTEEFAAHVVAAHNRTLVLMTYTERERLISDLEKILEVMKSTSDGMTIEDAISRVTQDRTRSKRAYEAIGMSVEMLQSAEYSVLIPHAINRIRSQ